MGIGTVGLVHIIGAGVELDNFNKGFPRKK